MYRITIKVNGYQQAMSKVRAIHDLVDEKKDDFAFAALNEAGSLFEKNFDTEGSAVGGWQDLAERTVQEREALGFGGEHPILVRYGDLREVTATSLKAAGASGTFSATDNEGKSISVSLEAKDGRLNVTAAGVKALNQRPGPDRPARPYWFVNADVQREARKGVVKKLVTELKRL